MKTLNLTKPNINKDVDEPTKINELEFWTYYLNLLMAIKGKFLRNAELKLLSALLSLNPDRTYFNRFHIDELIRLTGFSYKHIFLLKTTLVRKGFIVKASKGKGDYLLTESLRSFQKALKAYFEKDNTLELKFVFKIEDYEKSTEYADKRI